MTHGSLATALPDEDSSMRSVSPMLGLMLTGAFLMLLIAAGGAVMRHSTSQLTELSSVKASQGLNPSIQHRQLMQGPIRALRFTSTFFALSGAMVILALLGLLGRSLREQRETLRRFKAANAKWASALAVLDNHGREMELRSDARDQLQMCVCVNDAYDVMTQFIARLLAGTSGALCIIDNSRQMIEVQRIWGRNTDIPDAFPVDSCCGLRTGRNRWRDPGASVINCGHFMAMPPERYVCLPLIAYSDTLGVLYIDCASDEAASTVARNLDPLCALLQLSSMTIAALRLRSKLENQSIRDDLTGLFNRRFMEIALERELRRASRKEASLAVFMIDVDHFKGFNDTYGHKAGDTILREIAERFLSTVRGEDLVCRYGGEEFVIILPDITANKALERAESIRAAIAALRVSNHGQSLGPVTISVGVAAYPQDGRDLEFLLQAADQRLYTAKHNGRNQIVFAGQTARIPARLL